MPIRFARARWKRLAAVLGVPLVLAVIAWCSWASLRAPTDYLLVSFGDGGAARRLLAVRGATLTLFAGDRPDGPSETFTALADDDGGGFTVPEIGGPGGERLTEFRLKPRGRPAAPDEGDKDGDEYYLSARVPGGYLFYQFVTASRRPGDAAHVPLERPWTLLTYFHHRQVWPRGDAPREVVALVQTGRPGQLHPTPAFLECEQSLPKDIHPVVDLEFPTPDGVVRQRVELTERC